MPFLPFDAAGNWSSEVTWALLDAEAGTVGTRIFAKINHSVLEQSCPCVHHSVPGSREGQTQLELLSGGIREYVWSPYRRRNLHISVQWDLKSERSLLILSYNFWIDNILQLLHQAWHPPFVQEATESLLKKLRNSWGLKDHHTSLKVLSCWPAFIYLFIFFFGCYLESLTTKPKTTGRQKSTTNRLSLPIPSNHFIVLISHGYL